MMLRLICVPPRSKWVRMRLLTSATPSSSRAIMGSSSSCIGAVLPYPGWMEAMATAMAVGAPSRRNPGSGLEPCEMGSPARRPLGVAPIALPSGMVLAHEKMPGISLNPSGVGRATTASVKAQAMRLAHSSARVPPVP